MKILICSHFFAPSTGGVETYARLLAEGLTRRNEQTHEIEVTVVTHTPAQPNYDAQFPFQIVRQPTWFDLLRLIRGADVVQLAGPSLLPMLLALILGRPFVIEQHGYQAVCPSGMLLYEPGKEVCPGHFQNARYEKCVRCNRESLSWGKSLQMLLLTFPRRWLCRRAAANIAITSHVAHKLDLPKTHIVYYGVPEPSSCTASSEHSQGLGFAYVGRFVSEKGILVLLHAARRLRDQGYSFSLKLIGDGPQRQELETSVTALALDRQVTFTGFLNGRELEEALSDAAVVVMPSICEETAGLAAIEQMFRARLVIASDIGGLGEVVGSTGLKFPPGDVEALANCMKRVVEQPDIVLVLGRQARSRALDCFGLERMLDEYMVIYSCLCAVMGGRQ